MNRREQKERGRLLDANTVRFERILPGPMDLVWGYLTTREKMTTFDGHIRATPGAPVALSQDSDDLPVRNEGVIHGVVTRAEPPRLLAFTWTFVPKGEPAGAIDPAGQSEVILESSEHGDEVRLLLTHLRVPANHVPGAGAGWHAHLDRLRTDMTGGATESFFTQYERVLRDIRATEIWSDATAKADVRGFFQAQARKLLEAVGSVTEENLERCRVPLPYIGLVTAQESLFFTLLHTRHHLERVKLKLNAGPR